MRILHIGKFYPPDHGGMEVFLADLVGAQRAAGLNAHALVHGTAQPQDPAWLTRVPVKAQLLYTPIAPAFRSHLRKAIASFKPQLLHLHMPNPSVFWALTLPEAREIPWVVHWHSDVLSERSWSALSVAYVVYRPFEQAVLDQAQQIIVTSPDYLRASRPLQGWRDKCTVVPLGIDLSKMPTHARLDQSRGEVWPEHCFKLLSVGRLAHYKGFESLIEAVAGLDKVHLVIVGEGEARAQLEALIAAEHCRNVSLVGAIDEARKHALLAQCDLFCLASRERTEAFGIAVLEAMQHGKPCIVSELPGSGLPWLVRSSDAGVTIPLGDVAAWRKAIESFRTHPEQAADHGKKAQQASATRFDITMTARAIAECYPRAEIAPVSKVGNPLIVIPARNEAATIASVIRAVQAQGFDQIVVVSDQSSDDTAALARQAGATVLEPVLPLGAWGAMQTGIRYALRHGYDQVITLDADGQHEPGYIGAMRSAAHTSDVVIGAYPERGSTARRIAWRYFRWITGFRIEDLTSGFRCYNRAACEVLASEEATLLDYQDLGVLLLLRAAGLRIVEVPVEMYPRVGGPSRIFSSWGRVARYMLESTLLCLAQWHPRRHRAP